MELQQQAVKELERTLVGSRLPRLVACAVRFITLQRFHALEIGIDRIGPPDFRLARRTGVALGYGSFSFLGVERQALLDAHRSSIGDVGEGNATKAGNMLIFLLGEGAAPGLGMQSPRTLYVSRRADDDYTALATGRNVPATSDVASIHICLGEFTICRIDKNLEDIQLRVENFHGFAARPIGGRNLNRIALEKNGTFFPAFGQSRFDVPWVS